MSYSRHRPRRNRILKTEDWEKLRERVRWLDTDALLKWAEKAPGMIPVRLADNRITVTAAQIEVCPVVVMDPSQLGTCSGPWHLDHVKDDPMMGRKAPDDEWHLVSLCAGHDERGMRAGFVWCSANRDKERTYLREHRPERPRGVGSGA